MVQFSRLRSERSGFEPWPGTLCCVLRQDTFTFTLPLSTQVYKWVLASLMLPCDGLASHPGGEEILLVTSCY